MLIYVAFYIHMYSCFPIYTYMHTSACACECEYVHIHTYTCTHTQTPICKHEFMRPWYKVPIFGGSSK